MYKYLPITDVYTERNTYGSGGIRTDRSGKYLPE